MGQSLAGDFRPICLGFARAPESPPFLFGESMSDLTDALARIEKLEELVAHQALAIEELGDQLYAANEARDMLAKHQKALLHRIQEVEETHSGGPSAHEKPPHY